MQSIRTPVFVNGYKDLDVDMKQSKNKTTSEISPSDYLFIPEAKETTKGSTHQRLTRADMSARLSQAISNIKNLNIPQRERPDSCNSISDLFSNHK